MIIKFISLFFLLCFYTGCTQHINNSSKNISSNQLSNINVGHLIISSSANHIIANSTDSIVLTLVNSGVGNISNIQPTFINNNSNLHITANSCSLGITPNSSCSITLIANNSSIWQTDGIKIEYNDSINDLNIVLPVIVKPNNNIYGSLNVSLSGTLVNTKINETSTLTVNVNNDGSLPVKNVSVTAFLPIHNEITQTSNTCSSVLNAGASCQLVFQYTPVNVSVNINSFKFITTGKYDFASHSVAISNGADLQYSTFLSHLAYIYTQSGSNINSWLMNKDYSFTSVGSPVALNGAYSSIVYNHNLLIFNSTNTVKSYPIYNDGSLGSAVTVTVNPSFNVIPNKAVWNHNNGYLYVATVNSGQINTYKCLINNNIMACTFYSNSFASTIVLTGFDYGNTSTLFYSINIFAQMLYSNSDGEIMPATGASNSRDYTAMSVNNLTSNKTIVYADKYADIYSLTYNVDGFINNFKTLTPINISNYINQLFLQELGHDGYIFPQPLLYVLSNNILTLHTLDNTYSASPIPTTTVLQFAVDYQ